MFLRLRVLKRHYILLGFVIGIFVLASISSIEAQDTRPSRFAIEDIPYKDVQESESRISEQVIQRTDILPWSKVTFQSYRDDNWNIYVGNDDGTGQSRLTAHNAAEIHPHLNRGNTQIVYARKNGDFDIFKMNADGSNQVALTSDSTDDGNPVWSPDGTKIAFESYRDGQAEIYVMNANGSGQTRLTVHGDFDGMPTWSPDGTKIAFVSRRTGGYRIYVMNANGSNQVQVSTQPYSLRPQWSPDGSQIAFDADADGDGWQDIWRMNADGSSQVKVYDPPGTTDAWVGSWSPDGRYIAYTQISFVQYQGNWYWTEAFLDGVDVNNHGRFRLSSNGVDWTPRWQTSDNITPVSYFHTLPAQSPGPIPVSWSAVDQGGAGIAYYDVQVKDNVNGAWQDWRSHTGATSAQYPGIGGKTYYFRVRSSDRSINQEGWRVGYDAVTTVENLPPVSTVFELSPFTRYGSDLVVNWKGDDPGRSGIAHYDVQYRIDSGSWTDWQVDTTTTSAVLATTQPGEVIDFRVRATDRAQNEAAWQNQSDAQTTIYRWGISGTIFDNTHTPIGNAVAETLPEEVAAISSEAHGYYETYVVNNSNVYSTTWSKLDYTSLPETPFVTQEDKHLDVVLPPLDNLITNWGFETGSFAPEWTTKGTLPSVITNSIKHTGKTAVWLGNTKTNVFEPMGGDRSRALAVDAAGRAHIIWTTPRNLNSPIIKLYYMHQLDDGSWTTPQDISSGINGAYEPRIEVAPNGEVHVLWQANEVDGRSVYLYHMVRNIGGTWSSPKQLSLANPDYTIQVMNSLVFPN